MRFTSVVPFLPLASALVITEAEVFENLEKYERSGKQLFQSTQDVLGDAFGKVVEEVKNVGEDVYHKIYDAGHDIESWLEGSPFEDVSVDFDEASEEPDHPPHRRPPHHGRPPHHRKPHHPPHDQKPNLTVYELISKSKYTTKLAELINEFDDLVEVLNGTKANYTIFAPTDAAFAKIPEHGKKPSKEVLKKILLYHVSDSFYPARRVLSSYTIPTLYEPEKLGGKQRLTVRFSLQGPKINFYSKIIATNIFGTNGVIHGVDSILVPPPNAAAIINLLPGSFSTFELALEKTGLYEKLNDKDAPHEGGTLFVPTNFAFQKLGPRANAFLFSKYGLKYLKAILEYHIVVNQTLYTDAFYDNASEDVDSDGQPPYLHFDLPTVLHDKYLAVDVVRRGPFISIRINGFAGVTTHDGVASDGVIQVVSNVLIPPKTTNGELVYWQGEELEVEDLKERLEPFISEDNLEL